MDKSRVLVFVFAAVGTAAWAFLAAVNAWRKGLRGEVEASAESGLRDLAYPLGALGYRTSRLFSGTPERAVAGYIAQCGGLSGLTPIGFFGFQVLWSMCLGGVTFGLCLLSTLAIWLCATLGLGGAALGWYGPYSWLRARAKRRQKAVLQDLPFCLDLLASSMQAGYDFGSAMGVYIEKGKDGPLRDELAQTAKEIRLGKTRREGLSDLAERMGLRELRTITTAIIQGSEMGSAVANILEVQASDFRRQRFARAEKTAAHAPAKMIFPLALFVVPATMIIILAPIVLKFLRR